MAQHRNTPSSSRRKTRAAGTLWANSGPCRLVPTPRFTYRKQIRPRLAEDSRRGDHAVLYGGPINEASTAMRPSLTLNTILEGVPAGS